MDEYIKVWAALVWNGHRNTIHNSFKLETTQTLINRRMNKFVIYLPSGIL